MKKRLYVIAIIITLVLSLLVVKVDAADLSFTASMKASSTTVDKGKEFTINLNVSNLNVGDKGINSLSGYLEFDDKVFEDISADSMEGLNDWSVTYSEDTGKITLLKTSFVNENQDICQITLKTKSDTTSSKGIVELKDIVASNSESEITAQDISLEVGIGASSSSSSNSIKISSGNNTNTNTNSTNTKNNTNSNTNTNATPIVANTNNSNKNTNTNTNTNTNSKSLNANKNSNDANTNSQTDEEEMPDTGIDDTIVKAIILVALVGVLGYIKLKSLDQK